jgi:hypothetical protein
VIAKPGQRFCTPGESLKEKSQECVTVISDKVCKGKIYCRGIFRV